MGALFEVPKRLTKSQDKKIAKSSMDLISATTTVKGGSDIMSRINKIKALVEKNLGQYRDTYQVIQDKEVLHDFITECIGNGYIAIDTETTGLDPMLDQIAGICPFTPGQKGAYIPLNHVSYITNLPIPDQLPVSFVAQEFKRLLDKKPEIDMFNANFDTRVLKHQAGIECYCSWDGYLASRLLNENEPHKNLKDLHNKYCLNGEGDAFRFDDLFKGIPFTLIPIQTAYLYAAHDPEITYQLCEYQRKHLREDSDREDIRQLYWVFKNIEMPCVSVVADMEDTGVLFDLDYAEQLSTKYHELSVNKETEVYSYISEYQDKIDQYKRKVKDNKLDDPINIGSPTQLAILLYDILGIDPPDKKKPRGTGEEILTKIDNPICKAILEYRELQKLISTYIDKLPNCVNPNDGRIHCKFNQYGADTGRFSSQDPNLQNIPSHNKDIRKMFVASCEEQTVIVESDSFEVSAYDEVETPAGFVEALELKVGDVIKTLEGEQLEISAVVPHGNFMTLHTQISC